MWCVERVSESLVELEREEEREKREKEIGRLSDRDTYRERYLIERGREGEREILLHEQTDIMRDVNVDR